MFTIEQIIQLVVFLLMGFAIGQNISELIPIRTVIRILKREEIEEDIKLIIIARQLMLFLGITAGVITANRITEEYLKLIMDATLGLLAASGLIFTFVLGNQLSYKSDLQKDRRSIMIKLIDPENFLIKTQDDDQLDMTTRVIERLDESINEINTGISNVKTKGILCITMYIITIISVIFHPHYMLNVAMPEYLNIGVFTGLMLGLVFLIEVLDYSTL